MKKLLITTNVFFLAISLVLAYVLLFTGTELVKTPDDTRITVKYAPDLRELVMTEMRDYLEIMSEIQQGIAENDPKRIYTAAERQGSASIEETPIRLLKLSPLACKQMGFAGHHLFQAIADSARENYNPTTTIKQMARLTNNCIACHRTYKVVAE
ncbi:MAG: hypothetical protein DRI86_13310 [Bacteroidetes bacterium]|nr:MAG: hypothetical protein DRI86_13310 [Bacteroidota bacterium]